MKQINNYCNTLTLIQKALPYLRQGVMERVLNKSEEFQNIVLKIVTGIKSGKVSEVRFQSQNDHIDYVKTCWETWECPNHPAVSNMSRETMIREIVLFLLNYNDYDHYVVTRTIY